jgi:hypothetical protein
MLSIITLVALGTPAVGLVTYAMLRKPDKNDLDSTAPSEKDWYK